MRAQSSTKEICVKRGWKIESRVAIVRGSSFANNIRFTLDYANAELWMDRLSRYCLAIAVPNQTSRLEGHDESASIYCVAHHGAKQQERYENHPAFSCAKDSSQSVSRGNPNKIATALPSRRIKAWVFFLPVTWRRLFLSWKKRTFQWQKSLKCSRLAEVANNQPRTLWSYPSV